MGFTKCLTSLAMFLQVACATAVLVITILELAHYTVNVENPGAGVSETCALGTFNSGWSMCTYVYVVAGVSLAASLLLSMLLCCTCNLCGIGGLLDAIFAALGTAWWAIASIVLTRYSAVPSNLDVKRWYDIIVALAWASCGLFAFALLLYLIKALSACCSCLCCCDSGSSHHSRKRAQHDVEAPVKHVAYPPQPQYAQHPNGQFIRY